MIFLVKNKKQYFFVLEKILLFVYMKLLNAHDKVRCLYFRLPGRSKPIFMTNPHSQNQYCLNSKKISPKFVERQA